MLGVKDRVKISISKALSTETHGQNKKLDENVERAALFSSRTASFYIEEEPHVADWIREKTPKYNDLVNYVQSLFPFTQWILNYSVSWLMGDLVAGITIGAVVVPQGMAYSVLAGLPPQYGLYTSFMGVLLYWLFGTSKDISIGPIAIMSILVGNVIAEAKVSNPDIPGHIIASAFSLISGVIIVFIGLIRCGWLIELIPLVSIAAFTTGSAIAITIGQIPGLLGIKGLDKDTSTYQLLTKIFENIQETGLDAAIGLSSLFFLYFFRSACKLAARKFPSQDKRIFFLSTLRTVFIIILFTMISWLVNRTRRSKPLFGILSTIPSGFSAASVPVVNRSVISTFSRKIPVSVTLLLIEHIAVGKIFGSINNYVINPSQEMVAIGITNILGSFIGGFAATGSFSRTAISSKAGVRTPFAGVITAVEVLLAIFVLPAVFFYIPFSVLSAVIIHSVLDLVTPPSTVFQLWRVSPIEVPIFFIGIIVVIFSSIENGLYVTTGISFIILIVRFVKAKGKFLGTVQIQMATSDFVISNESLHHTPSGDNKSNCITKSSSGALARYIFPPLDFSDGINPEIEIQHPQPGIFIYRFSQNLNYLSACHYLDQLTRYVYANTRRTAQEFHTKLADRPWNHFSEKRQSNNSIERPILKAIILDFSAVNTIDFSSVQQLADVRKQFNLYASPEVVEWHFSNVNNRWTKRALIAAGFGSPSIPNDNQLEPKPIFGIAQISNSHSCTNGSCDLEKDIRPCMAMVSGLNRPYFHVDLMTAWLSVAKNIPKEQKKVMS